MPIELAARGRGSLVGSLVSADPQVVRDLVLGVAPWHGRVLVLDQDSAAESTGHGSPLPHLVHGGPGRAGDGEELGGIRGVLHYMQRTADPGFAGGGVRGHRDLGDRGPAEHRGQAPVPQEPGRAAGR